MASVTLFSMFSLLVILSVILGSNFKEIKDLTINNVRNIIMKNDQNKRRKDSILNDLYNLDNSNLDNEKFQHDILSRLDKEIHNNFIDQSESNQENIFNNILDILDNVGNRYLERNNEIMEALNDFPKELVEFHVIEYDSKVNYKFEFNLVMKVLKKNDSKSSFYKNDFIFKLTEYLKELSPSALDQLNSEFYDALLKLVVKWTILKENEYNLYGMKSDSLLEDVRIFGEFFSSIDKNKINYRFKKFSRQDESFRTLVYMEIVENWESILSDLKSIHEDFYLKGHDRQYLINKYFQGKLEGNFLLLTSFKEEKSLELVECLFASENNRKASQSYSEKDIEEMRKNSYLIFWSEILNDKELKLFIKTGHKVLVNDNYKRFMELITRFERLDLLTSENLKRIELPEGEFSRERMLEMIKEIENDGNYKISEKLKELLGIKSMIDEQ